jgi:hypothetical protein
VLNFEISVVLCQWISLQGQLAAGLWFRLTVSRPSDFPQLQPYCGQRLLELQIEGKQAKVAEVSGGKWVLHHAIKNALGIVIS